MTAPAKEKTPHTEAVEAVLALFARKWPKQLPEAFRAEEVGIWQNGLLDIPAELLLPAAKRYLATEAGRFIPPCKEFNAFALRLTAKYAEATRAHTPFTPRAFWFLRDGVQRWATEAPGGKGWIGITDKEMQELRDGRGTWGWR